MSEIWKDIEGYEGLYQVSNLGEVRSIIQTSSRRKCILRQYQNENGYMKVNLYNLNGICKKKYIHRLVAESFIENPSNKPNINHIDCNVKNNNVNNLEWCTQRENVKYQVIKRRHAKAKPIVLNSKSFNSEKEASFYLFGNGWELSHKLRKGVMPNVSDKIVSSSRNSVK